MDHEAGILRAAITCWRDDYRLSAASSINAAAVKALLEFDRALSAAVWQDRIRFVTDTIDWSMRQAVERDLPTILNKAARGLRLIDRRLEPVALRLVRDVWPNLPVLQMPRQAADSKIEPVTTSSVTPGWPNFRSMLSAAAETVQAAQVAADDAGIWLREKAGVHGDLRKRARGHIASVWLGNDDCDSIVLTQVDAGLDAAAVQARELLNC